MASSVLWLVPSFPLINSLSDMLKGYMNIGIGRFMFVIILTLSSCIGIVLSLLLLNISHWGVGWWKRLIKFYCQYWVGWKMAIDVIALIRAATFACLMTLGWTLLVNVPRRYIWQCLLLTVLGYGLRELLKQLSVNLILATFVAAGISSFVAIYLAKNIYSPQRWFWCLPCCVWCRDYRVQSHD